MTRRLSPFLVLGIDYGSPADVAEQAFSRKARALRGMHDAPFTRDDLTWALNAVQHPTELLSTSVDYARVPAGRADFPAPQPGELFCPFPQPLARRTAPLTDQERLEMRFTATLSAIREIVETALGDVHNPYNSTREAGQ